MGTLKNRKQGEQVMTQQGVNPEVAKSPISAAQAGKTESNDKSEEKGYAFKCACCGPQWQHKVKNTSGLCKTCVEIRRGLNSFINKGTVTRAEMLKRVTKLLG